MITKMFSVFDSKAVVFGTPIFVPTKGAAIRSFSDVANDEKSSIGKHPEDYTLFYLGEYDDATGSFDQVNPEALLTASAVIIAGKRPAVPPEVLDGMKVAAR